MWVRATRLDIPCSVRTGSALPGQPSCFGEFKPFAFLNQMQNATLPFGVEQKISFGMKKGFQFALSPVY